MSASTRNRSVTRQNDRKSHRNKADRKHGTAPESKHGTAPELGSSTPVPDSISHVSSPWAPSTYTAFKALLSARLCAAIWSNIADCDEIYNYWEPLHYIIHNRGYQTWEYSPIYAIRSYAYIWLYALPLRLYVIIAQGHHMLEFYFLRTFMGFFCSLCEIFFYRSVCKRYGNNVGLLCLCFLLFGTGMFISSTSFLPSSFSMYMVFIALGAWYIQLYAVAVFGIAASAIIGWPFAGALGIPIAWDLVIRQKRIGDFIIWATLSAAICLLPLVFIDSLYYGKLVVAPLNIVLYNVFSEHGPDIYGIEPWTFYFMNGFLNFNFVFVLALVALPLMAIVNFLLKLMGHTKISKGELPAWLSLGPMYIWMIIFFTRPHKEERFLYPIYPMFCLAAALSIDHLQKLLYTMLSSHKSQSHHTNSRVGKVLVSMFCVAFITLSLSRCIALYKGYHGVLNVYSELSQIYVDPERHDLSQSRQVNVCVGKEWYRFPSNFFIPSERWKYQFIKSEFRGQLPKPYDSDSEATRIIPSHMNDRNLEETTRYIDVKQCHYLIDLDLPTATQYEPRYSKNTSDWKVVASAHFLHTQRSHPFYRAFYIPFLSAKHCVYVKYNLLKATKYKKIKA